MHLRASVCRFQTECPDDLSQCRSGYSQRNGARTTRDRLSEAPAAPEPVQDRLEKHVSAVPKASEDVCLLKRDVGHARPDRLSIPAVARAFAADTDREKRGC